MLEQSGDDAQRELQKMGKRLAIAERSGTRWRSRALGADTRARRHEDEIECLKR